MLNLVTLSMREHENMYSLMMDVYNRTLRFKKNFTEAKNFEDLNRFVLKHVWSSLPIASEEVGEIIPDFIVKSDRFYNKVYSMRYENMDMVVYVNPEEDEIFELSKIYSLRDPELFEPHTHWLLNQVDHPLVPKKAQ